MHHSGFGVTLPCGFQCLVPVPYNYIIDDKEKSSLVHPASFVKNHDLQDNLIYINQCSIRSDSELEIRFTCVMFQVTKWIVRDTSDLLNNPFGSFRLQFLQELSHSWMPRYIIGHFTGIRSLYPPY